MSEFSTVIRVYLEDTDAGGIVYYVNYLKFMERARTELLRHLGCEFDELYRSKLQFVVHSVEAKYTKPAQMDDQLTVSANVEKIARTYIQFSQQVRKGDTLMCDARIKVACIDAEKHKPAAIPLPLQQRFASVLA
jgi:4-hydroxybenzoyl-CoA thioesterase